MFEYFLLGDRLTVGQRPLKPLILVRFQVPQPHCMNIKEKWREHPLFKQGKIELVPTEWVWRYYGPDVSPEADLMDGTLVTVDELWENILEVGLVNPLIMRVGIKNKMFRLEAGNHRIQVFHFHGVSPIPVTVQLREECGPHVSDVMTDASHNFKAAEGDLLISTITEEYMAPSEVFAKLQRKTKAAIPREVIIVD